MVAGAISYSTLGRNEDPPFTFRTMVVQANWPGATLDEQVEQVTERLERTLQEVDNVDFLRSFTSAGVTRIFVNLEGATDPAVVPDRWYDVRKRIGDMRHTLPRGVLGPFFNDDFGDTFGIIYGFTADGFSQPRAARLRRTGASRSCCRCRTSPRWTCSAPRRADLPRVPDRPACEPRPEPGSDPRRARGAERGAPRGIVRTDREQFALRVSGAFASEQDLLDVNFAVGERLLRLRDIATVSRGYVDPPQSLFRVGGRPAIRPRDRHARRRRRSGRSARTCRRR